jgi:predicted CXXCH cytochrome family protein
MAFVLRTISHSAEGREIVRSSRVEGDYLTIGRAPECDVHLTDLAAALRHAVVERTADRLAVTAGEGLTVEVNGRKVTNGRIELGTGGDILIASHALRFMPTPAGSDEIAVNVERVTDSEVKLTKADERMFSLASAMPSKRAGAWLLSLLVLGVFLAWPIKAYYDRQQQEAAGKKFHPDTMWSSGKLSQVHTGLENNCQACHVKAFEAVRDESCKACHTKVHDHADPFRLARAQPDLDRWGKIQLAFKETFDIPPGRCVECHTEHEGPQAMPATAQRFCSDCHETLKEKLPDTRLANAGDFGKSHPEFQPSLITRWNGNRPMLQRVSLAQRPQEISNLKFPHDMHLSTTNGVAQMARRLSRDHGFGQSLVCADCHDSDPSGTRFQPVNMEQDCAMCHSLEFKREGGLVRTLRHGEPEQVVADLRDFYRGNAVQPPPNFGGVVRRRPGEVMEGRTQVQFVRAATNPARADQAIRAVFSRGGACYDCHQVQAPRDGSLNFKIRPVAFPVRYMHHGWFDHKPHEQEKCETCHKANASGSATDLLLPDLASCRSCHGGEGSSSDVPSSCAMCHDYHMDSGTPSMLLRQRVRGKKRDTTVASADTGGAGKELARAR